MSTRRKRQGKAGTYIRWRVLSVNVAGMTVSLATFTGEVWYRQMGPAGEITHGRMKEMYSWRQWGADYPEEGI